MAKKFQFDDEDDLQDYQYTSRVDEFKNLKEDSSKEKTILLDEFEDEENLDLQDEDDIQVPKSKKRKLKWRWWYYVIIVLFVLFVLFAVYIFMTSRNNGPVYGNRCDDVVSINKDLRTSAIDTVKNEYKDEILDYDIEVVCKQVKIDITFVDGIDTKRAIEIAEKSVQVLDNLVGQTKDEGKTYSQLFGYIDNEAQYEVDLFLQSQNSEGFPIYGTKHVQNDEFSYTLSSVKDQESYQKAKDTLEEE